MSLMCESESQDNDVLRVDSSNSSHCLTSTVSSHVGGMEECVLHVNVVAHSCTVVLCCSIKISFAFSHNLY